MFTSHAGKKYQYAWDSTSLGLLKTCPRKYQLSILETWIPSERALPLSYGIAVHECQETFYQVLAEAKAQGSPTPKLDALREAVRHALAFGGAYFHDETTGVDGKFIPWAPVDKNNIRTRETLVRTVIWYHLNYWDDPISTITLANGKAAVELSFRYGIQQYAPDGTEYLLCGHLDRLTKLSDRKVYDVDYKTTQHTLDTKWFSQFTPHNQMSGYDFGVNVIYGPEAGGVIVSGIQIGVTFSRFLRGFAYRTAGQREEWIRSTIAWIKIAEGLTLSGGDFPMDDTACSHYGGCHFQGICGRDPSVRKNLLLGKGFVQKQWDPLQVR